MQELHRRSFLGMALAALPLALFGQTSKRANEAVYVAAGEDRFGKTRVRPVGTSAFKVLTEDSGGGLLVMESTHRKRGGPPRHVHQNEDEWFYFLEGDYILEVGSDRYRPKPGDSVFAPRGVPHAFAFVGNTPGRMVMAFAPAGKMEAFFAELEGRTSYFDDPTLFRAYGMQLVGPPLEL